jgi:hypothetical protein
MTEGTGKKVSAKNAAGRSRNESDSALDKEKSQQAQQPAHRVRLPGFITDDEIGLGDVVKRTTSYFGVKPCGGCERRAAALNRWLAFTPRNRK